jgi:hypothetical protein
MDALKGFPDFETKLVTEKRMQFVKKQDIFKGLMWFAYIILPTGMYLKLKSRKSSPKTNSKTKCLLERLCN